MHYINLDGRIKLIRKTTLGIDLAGNQRNPTGWATLANKTVKAGEIHTDKEIIELVRKKVPILTALDAPLSLPRRGILRKADREMIKRGYRVFPPRLAAMEGLTLRALRLIEELRKLRFQVIEVHPTSTRKALSLPLKEWRNIQTLLTQIGLKGDIKVRVLTSHEIDAVIAALTAHLHLRGETVKIGNNTEGYIVVPKKMNWRQLIL
jgi:hypothetical protein